MSDLRVSRPSVLANPIPVSSKRDTPLLRDSGPDRFVRQASSGIAFGLAKKKDSLSPDDIRQVITRLAIDGELTGEELRLIPNYLKHAGAAILTPFTPDSTGFQPQGHYLSDAPEASAQTPFGLLYLRALVDRNPSLEQILLKHCRSQVKKTPTELITALGSIGFDGTLTPATEGYQTLMQQLFAQRTSDDDRRAFSTGLGRNPNIDRLPESVQAMVSLDTLPEYDHDGMSQYELAERLGLHPRFTAFTGPLKALVERLLDHENTDISSHMLLGIAQRAEAATMAPSLAPLLNRFYANGDELTLAMLGHGLALNTHAGPWNPTVISMVQELSQNASPFVRQEVGVGLARNTQLGNRPAAWLTMLQALAQDNNAEVRTELMVTLCANPVLPNLPVAFHRLVRNASRDDEAMVSNAVQSGLRNNPNRDQLPPRLARLIRDVDNDA